MKKILLDRIADDFTGATTARMISCVRRHYPGLGADDRPLMIGGPWLLH
jgi:hypothetical protein